MLELRQEIAAMLQRRYGLSYDPVKQLLVTVGVSEGVDLAMASVTRSRRVLKNACVRGRTGLMLSTESPSCVRRKGHG